MRAILAATPRGRGVGRFVCLATALLCGSCVRAVGHVGSLGDGSTGRADQRSDAPLSGDSSDAACEGTLFYTPVRIEEASVVGYDDWEPAVSADELILVFDSWRPDKAGESDLWMAARDDARSAFSEPVNLQQLNGPYAESGPSLSADGLTICFASDRPGVHGRTNLYLATRPDREAPFGAPTELTELNSDSWDGSCDLDSEALVLVFASGRQQSDGTRDLWIASRPSTTEAFDPPTRVAGVNSPADEIGPSLSADGLELYFASDRAGGLGLDDIYLARRESSSAPFGEMVNLTNLNSANDDVGPNISRDGNRLYLNRNARVYGGPVELKADLWVAERRCGRGP